MFPIEVVTAFINRLHYVITLFFVSCTWIQSKISKLLCRRVENENDISFIFVSSAQNFVYWNNDMFFGWASWELQPWGHSRCRQNLLSLLSTLGCKHGCRLIKVWKLIIFGIQMNNSKLNSRVFRRNYSGNPKQEVSH